ncbi:MAG: DUF447 family protein [Thermoplasmata archaeon]|nr:DUF447 family protein [Thermoplasmata archaeon]
MRVIEAVVVTKNSHINAAAIGVWYEGEFYRLRVFENSNTYANLIKDENFSINFVSPEQLDILVRCALAGHNNQVQELADDAFLFWHGVPYLKGTFSVIAKVDRREFLVVEDWVGKSKCLLVEASEVQRCGELRGTITREEFNPLLESAVLATKYFDASAEAKVEIRRRVEALLPLIEGFEEEVGWIREIVEIK